MVTNTNVYEQCNTGTDDVNNQKGAALNCNKTGTKFAIHFRLDEEDDPPDDIASLFTSVRIWTEEIVSTNAEYILPFDSTTSHNNTQMTSLYSAGSFSNRGE